MLQAQGLSSQEKASSTHQVTTTPQSVISIAASEPECVRVGSLRFRRSVTTSQLTSFHASSQFRHTPVTVQREEALDTVDLDHDERQSIYCALLEEELRWKARGSFRSTSTLSGELDWLSGDLGVTRDFHLFHRRLPLLRKSGVRAADAPLHKHNPLNYAAVMDGPLDCYATSASRPAGLLTCSVRRRCLPPGRPPDLLRRHRCLLPGRPPELFSGLLDRWPPGRPPELMDFGLLDPTPHRHLLLGPLSTHTPAHPALTGTQYTFTLYSVFENVRSSGVSITAVTAPSNAQNLISSGQNETSITLQWNKVNNNVNFVLQFNGTETNISAPARNGPVNHTVSSLTAGTQYTFTLYSVFENVRSSGVSITAVTAPSNAQNLISSGQNETSITLQWNKVNNNVSFVLQFNGTETNISAPARNGPVNQTVSSLTAGTQYTFTLYSVFENIRSSGVSITAVTAPSNAQNLISSGQNETSITLQWNKVNNNVSFVLQFNGTETEISAPAGNGPLNHTVSSLTAGTQYTFTLYSVFENVRSSGVNITAVTAPSNAQNLISSGQNETSITLQWNKVNNNVSFVLQFNGTETSISAPAGNGPVNQTVSSLTAGTQYTFTLYSVFENVRSSGVSITAVTSPSNAQNLISSGQNETSITLQWNKVNNNVSFVLQFNGTETSISAPAGNGPVNQTVSSLTAGTQYTFTLYSVFENVRSSGVSITAVTAPSNAQNLISSGQNETSITLQWNKVNNNVSFVLQFNGTETSISAPAGNGPVNQTVSSLTAGTQYTFTLYSVFENVRSSGVSITAVTAPSNAQNLISSGQNETSITLQWNKVNNNVSFVLQFNGTETSISAPAGNGPVNQTVSSLTAGTQYTFTLYSVFENVRSSGVTLLQSLLLQMHKTSYHQDKMKPASLCSGIKSTTMSALFSSLMVQRQASVHQLEMDQSSGVTITAVTAPSNAQNLISSGQNETSITLQWNKVNNNVSFVLQFNAPSNAQNLISSGQNETSITLQWNKVNNNVSFVLQFNGTETSISAPAGNGPENHTVSSLTAGTQYTFTLYSVFENVRSSGVSITAVTAPSNAQNLISSGQNETSITLQWNKVNNNVSFVLQFNGTETSISAPAGNGPVNQTVSSLTAGTQYTFTLYSVFENVRSSGVSITAVTAPSNAQNLISSGQNETSITLQWNKVNNNVSFVLQFNGTETSISAPAGNGPVNQTVSSLTAGTQYTFTLYSVFENVRSSGVSITAVTAPSNAQNLISSGQNETSITLQWNKVNNNVSFVLQFNRTDTNISAPARNGPVNQTVSSLTAGTQYTFTLYSVFENVRSSGVNITAVTAPSNAQNLISSGQNETSITLQWNKVNNNVSFVLQFNGTETNISAPARNGPENHTVSSLTAGTQYTFTLYSVFENVRSSGVSITAVTAPSNAQNLISSGQNETSITLQWNKVNNNVSFVLQFNGTETSISAPAGNGPVNQTVSSLTAGTQYTFTLYSVFENVRSSGVTITAVTAPSNAQNLISSGQNETSITLQWNKVNNNVSFVLQFNGTETSISAPAGNGPVNQTVSSLTAGTQYTFTLYSVFENVRSSGVTITAVTAPSNAQNLISSGQNETSITLQWNKVNNNVSFVLQFNGTETSISAPAGNGPVNQTVSSLTAGTQYTFTLYSVFENVRSSGVSITAVTAPSNAQNLISSGQNETSITLQWNKVNNNVSFVLQFNGTETSISAPAGNGPVNQTVSSLTAGTQYTFTLYSVFENVRSSGVSITAVTAPSNAQNLISSGQNETSITLQWNKVNNNVSFVLQFNGTETSISAPAGNGPVNQTVSSLTAGTQYTFTLYSVFENVRSSGVSITAVTAPSNAQNLISSGQNETSITLQWNKVNNNVSFVLQFNGTETSISAPAGNGPVNQTVSSLTAGTQYTFTLYSVFENVRSSGVSITAVTAPSNAQNLISSGQNETSITLQWNKVNNNVSFVLQFNGTETSISAPAGNGPVNQTVSSLTAGTQYTFTLYSVFENVRSSGVSITAVTAPSNAQNLISSGQNETSITLQWNKVNNNVSFVLQFNGTETSISAPAGNGPVNQTVSSLTAGTQYTFTLYSVFENVRSSGVSITAVTAPSNAQNLISSGQNETSITLQWNKVNNNVSFVLQFNGTETSISAPAGNGPVNQTVSSLTAGTQYTFTLYSVFENVRSSGVSITAVTAPSNAQNLISSGQNETSITLQWNKVNNNVSFVLQFNGTETSISAPAGNGPVNQTVSSLTAGTQYTFTLYSVFENVRSSGVSITAVTAPSNAQNLISSGQNETSITLQWNKVNNNVSFVLQFNGTETSISAPAGNGPVNQTVSSLTAGTQYTFTLYSVFENVRSSGVSITAVTAPSNAQNLISSGQNETSITLQWNKVNNNVSFVLQFNGTETSISAPAGNGPVNQTVSSLTAGTQYTFTLYSVFENVRSSGVTITAVTAPSNAQNLISSGQNETSITLQWNKVNNNVSFVLQFNGTETSISAPAGNGPVNQTVSSLTAGTQYTFTLYSVFENVRSSGVTITAVTAPSNAQNLISSGQNETSITLQWNKVNNNVSFVLQFNGTETSISAPAGNGPVNQTVSSLTAGTQYTFTLYSVFENVRSSGVSITAVTAPSNAQNLISSGQNETSITLQWNKVNNNVSFVLQFNGTETSISAPAGNGPVNQTVSSLTAGTQYTFTLYSVFENVRSSGVTLLTVS
ncbi:tenascin-X-like [Astatotilapia calliptera]|uniref:tenascin-X-like n=1 Tax=Astatotilapia calliptera TaxID=8154 RepID=UPI000E400E91|nr:tenascin-X-like [Astatotilapia calliptera]